MNLVQFRARAMSLDENPLRLLYLGGICTDSFFARSVRDGGRVALTSEDFDTKSLCGVAGEMTSIL